jgi:hypothetical protein
VGQKKVVKIPVKKISLETDRGILTDKISNIRWMYNLLKDQGVSKGVPPRSNREQVLRMLKGMEAAAPFINPKLQTPIKLNKKWTKEDVSEYFGSSWKNIRDFAERYKISNKDIMKYMASRVIHRQTETTKKLGKALATLKIKGTERATIIRNKKTFIEIYKNLAQKKGEEDDRTHEDRLYQAVHKAKQRTRK